MKIIVYVLLTVIVSMCIAQSNTTSPQEKRITPTPEKSEQSQEEKIDINSASLEELLHLPGIEAKHAQAIIAGRPYKHVEDLLEVNGIDEKRLVKFRHMIEVTPIKIQEEGVDKTEEEQKQETLAEVVEVDWGKLFDGEVIVEDVKNIEGIRGVRAMFTVSASRERIWAVLNDYDNFCKIFKEYKKIDVLEQNDVGAQVKLWIKVYLKTFSYTLYRHYEKPGTLITWKRIAGAFKRIEGHWEIHDTPRSGVYLLICESYFEIGGIWGFFNPSVRWEAMRKAPEMGKHLRNWIENMPLND